MEAKHKIFIVDDHPIVRQGLASLISGEPDLEVLGEAADAEEALRKVKVVYPDLIILDIQLNGVSGIELIRDFRGLHPKIRVLVSSIHDEMVFAERALRAGAMGYICKRESVRKIVEAVYQVLHDEIYLSPRMANHLLHRVADGQKTGQGIVQGLTDRELEVFEMIGRGFTSQQVADKLFVSTKTIETHRQNIKRKLNLQNSVQLVRSAFHWVLENS
jgi:DNA-binding NarL/FixJ family response regulator